jgi:hypothetical protein
MPPLDSILPYILCGACGGALAVIELLQTFGKWLGRFGRNRYAAALVVLNAVTAIGVFAFVRHVLEIESGLGTAVLTGLTFPTILRTDFTYFRAIGGEKEDPEQPRLSIPVHTWYRSIEDLCYKEVDRAIADARAQAAMGVRRSLSQDQVVAAIDAHIAAEIIQENQTKHRAELEQILALTDDKIRLTRLAAFMVDILPEARVRELLEEAGK